MWRIIFILILISNLSFAKKIEIDTFLVQKELEINEQLLKLRSATNDALQLSENESLIQLIESILEHPGTMTYDFTKFETISTIKSPDDAFRLFNWNIENSEGVHQHFCYALLPNRGNKPNTVIKFKEDKITIPSKPSNTLSPNTWYGALYYKILPIKYGNKSLYTVIGFNGGTRSSNKKMIDIFYFKGKKLRLGYPLFQEESESKQLSRRVFFEYAEKAIVGVNLNEELEAIVFDHLVPESENLKGLYSYYIPDMTYDGYTWNGEIWEYKTDFIAVNSQNTKTKQYKPTANGEAPEFVEVDDVWVNPVDSKSPAGAGKSAIAPVPESANNKKKSKRNKNRSPKKTKASKRTKKGNTPRSAIGNK